MGSLLGSQVRVQSVEDSMSILDDWKVEDAWTEVQVWDAELIGPNRPPAYE